MVFVSIYKEYHFALLVLSFVLPNILNGINCLQNQQKIPAAKVDVIVHEFCQSCPGVATLKDVPTYSELKFDPRASLPSSFTICVSVLVMRDNPQPGLFVVLGKNGQPWFSAKIAQFGNFVGRHFYYPVQNQFLRIETLWMFPNQWVRSCLALNTISGSVQWVARGELVDNSTLVGITNNVPTDLSGKVILGTRFFITAAKWWTYSSSKLTKLDIFSSALDIQKMVNFTKGEGCGDDGDYLSWDEMEWNLHGETEIEYMETEEICTMQSLNYYDAGFDMKSCMQFCQKLAGSRVPPVNSLLQWEIVRSIASRKKINWFWFPIHDAQNEGEWKDFYNHQVLNFTLPWFKGEPNGGKSQNCAGANNGRWFDEKCEDKRSCLCERQPSFHMRLRGLCADSAVDKY